ncbi:hypothetical protein HDC90_004415 [Pedobacter sp. AK013]|uniref:hypothetical protein n=1 Tax=Pedobacter sp. AK013 TaxID=2723071 RepID=UPI00160D3292|nr:hypothetical protein [Pedobacter sp. AK013]MBB6239754.1 hypothetical protein [Pedobacter sp. AK013]
MKIKQDQKQKKASLRVQIMESMLASFKIEGISIPHDSALSALKKIEFSLEK